MLRRRGWALGLGASAHAHRGQHDVGLVVRSRKEDEVPRVKAEQAHKVRSAALLPKNAGERGQRRRRTDEANHPSGDRLCQGYVARMGHVGRAGGRHPEQVVQGDE